MITTTIRYICSLCGAEFKSKELAMLHDKTCDKCKTCKHSYYVYGCEFNCEYLKDCSHPTYEHYEKE